MSLVEAVGVILTGQHIVEVFNDSLVAFCYLGGHPVLAVHRILVCFYFFRSVSSVQYGLNRKSGGAQFQKLGQCIYNVPDMQKRICRPL